MNMGQLIAIAKKYKTDPQGAINEGLALLEKKNPKGAETIRNALRSGKPPQQVLKEESSKGNINANDLNTIKSMYKEFSNDIPEKVPDSVWNTAEKAVNPNNKGFSGF